MSARLRGAVVTHRPRLSPRPAVLGRFDRAARVVDLFDRRTDVPVPPIRVRSVTSMELDVRLERPDVVAAVTGRFDAHGVPRFDEQVLDRIDAASPHARIDLAGVEFMDSSAVAALVRLLRTTMQHGGSLALMDISTPVRIILELTRLDQILLQVTTADHAAVAVGPDHGRGVRS